MAHQLELTNALVQAIEQDWLSSVESLLEQGANPNLILPSSGISPFHLAIGADTTNALEFVKLLLKYNGNPNIRSEDGTTPVHVAATWGRYQALGLLLRNGGDPDLCDEDGASAIDMAEEQENNDCYSILMTHKDEEEQDEMNKELVNVVTKYQMNSTGNLILQDPLSDHSLQYINSSRACTQESIHPSLDSTGLSDYLQDACITCSPYNSPHTNQDDKYLSRSFFPNLVPSTGAEAGSHFEPSQGVFKDSIRRREYFQNANFRLNLDIRERIKQSAASRELSEQMLGNMERGSDMCLKTLGEYCRTGNSRTHFESGETSKPSAGRRTLSEPKQSVRRSEMYSEIHDTSWTERFQTDNFRPSLDVVERIKPGTASRRTLSEPRQVIEACDTGSEICAFRDNSPVLMLEDEDDESDDTEELSWDRTLSSKDLEDAFTDDGCHGLDLTSPDHPMVFTKVRSSQSGETPPLDKTVIFIPQRRSSGLAVRIDRYLCEQQSTDVPPECRESNVSGESSAYVTCQSDEMFSCVEVHENNQLLDKQKKRNSRRVTFSDGCDSFCKVSKTTGFNEGQDVDVSRDSCGQVDRDGVHCQPPMQRISQQDKSSSPEETFDTNRLLDDSLITSDEDSFEAHYKGPDENSSMLRNKTSQLADSRVITAGMPDSHICQTSNEPHPLPSDSPPLFTSAIPVCGDTFTCGNESKNEEVEFLYHDSQSGSTFIERQCPSAMSSTHQDMSVLEYSLVSSDETMLYDWRDYQSEDDDLPAAQPLSRELLDLTDKGIREMMRRYGEEAGPITSSTRLVYLRHLAKLQDDPNFVRRAASRQHTEGQSAGFRWELAEYLNSGHLKESDHKMAAEEQVMVAPFQIPDPSRKWREGTLKSSFNYLLLDPRVTKDLPGRYTQLTALETFRVFVAATFYIGKGKRGRPYAHFYEALSSLKPTNDKDADRPTKKKEPGAKVSHILDIWSAGLGVVSLHCFQSVIPVEAYAREACMVEAVGLSRLTNIKKGDFYGPSTTWPVRQRRQMGVFLLKKACQIFLVEGERQIRPADIAVGQ